MSKEYFFISGLPRSGSTLLCNILSQNPQFYVSKSTSGCHDVLFGIRNQWDNLIEHQAGGIDYDQLKRVLNGALNNYHSTDKNIILDKGRGWLSLIEMIEFVLDKKCKVIVPVRNINEILASFEKLWRKTTGKTQWLFEKEDYFKSQTLAGRCDIWASASQPVGLAFNRVSDAINRNLKDRLLFVEMDDLTSIPAQTMKRVYNFINQDYFNHNFDYVEQVTSEDDIGVHRIEGLHTIRNKIEPVPHCSTEILGVELTQKYSKLEIWR
jgi:sulfotransferase